jgi:hypothetical protein
LGRQEWIKLQEKGTRFEDDEPFDQTCLGLALILLFLLSLNTTPKPDQNG